MSGSRTVEPLTVMRAAQVFADPAAYAVTRHPDVYEIATNHQVWLSASVFVSGLKRLPLRYRLR